MACKLLQMSVRGHLRTNSLISEAGVRVNRASGEKGFKALGAQITMIGDDNAELNTPLLKAWQACF